MPTRREMLGISATAAVGVMLPMASSAAPSVATLSGVGTTADKPLSILILGGTGFTGPHQVRYALSRGHKVTLFNRGRRPREWPAEVEELVGDRDTNDYAALKGLKWDVCIDNPTTLPHWVRDAATVLKGNVKHYIFISTISVYTDSSKPGSDETATREVYAGKDAFAENNASLRANMRLYGPLKAFSEDEAHRQFKGATTVIRPGLIVGPGDETDRFSYWPVRLARGGEVLVPPANDPVQFIDARDLAEWTIRVAETKALGDFNGHGPDYELSMGALLYGIRAVTASGAKLREASAEFLAQNKVNMWSDMPVWVPGKGETGGFHRRRNNRAITAGLTFRPLAVTAKDTLAWWEQQPVERKKTMRAGLTAEREAALLKLLDAAPAKT